MKFVYSQLNSQKKAQSQKKERCKLEVKLKMSEENLDCEEILQDYNSWLEHIYDNIAEGN